MRFTAIRFQQPFQLIERAAGEAYHLLAVIQYLNMIEPQGADNDNLTVIILAAGGRAFGQAGVGRLHNDNLIGGDAGLQDLPQLQQTGREHDGQCLATAGAETFAITFGATLAGQHLRVADDILQLSDKCLRHAHLHVPAWLQRGLMFNSVPDIPPHVLLHATSGSPRRQR